MHVLSKYVRILYPFHTVENLNFEYLKKSNNPIYSIYCQSFNKNLIMSTIQRSIVDKMFEAFNAKDLNKLVETFTDDAVCIYHGTQLLPSAKFLGKEGVRMFFEFNFNNLIMERFEKNKFVEDGDTIIVLGNEKSRSRENEAELNQKWVQVYTIKDGLISRMEEFATSALENQYGGNWIQ